MSSIQVGSKVKVVTGGRYLGKEGTVSHVGGKTALVSGHFPRSVNKAVQEFPLSSLELTGEIVKVADMSIGSYETIGVPQGGQHTVHTPMPTKADDAELEILGKSMSPDESKQFWDKHADLAPVKEGEQSRPFASPVSENKSAPQCDGGSAPSVAHTSGSALANRLASKFAPTTVPHLMIEALAGTGKTTTLIESLKRLKGIPSKLTPTAQQEAIWNAVELSKDARSICFVAFNKSIAEELKKRVPEGVDASTMHGLGFKTVMRAYGRVSVNEYRVSNIICELAGKYPDDLRRSQDDLFRTNRVLLKATEQLVGMCKMNLTPLVEVRKDTEYEEQDLNTNRETLDRLASFYEVDMDGGNCFEVYDLVPKVLERCKNVRKDMSIDYNDMIWLPVAQNLVATKYDVLLVDEFQDTNRCQQSLAKMSGNRLILVGDKNQAIYGFAGALSDSMDRMKEELIETSQGCTVLPLTQTRRCGKAIVGECRKLVPTFEAFETNPEGSVRTSKYPSKNLPVEKSFMAEVKDGDMVLCRCNAPLVSTCFRFLKYGRKATIQGRNIGQGLVSTIKKLKVENITDLSAALCDWRSSEIAKETAKKNPNENKLVNIDDRYDCLMMFMQDQKTVADVIRRIEGVFTDNRNNPGVKLSSIHKAKGTEADNVFLLQVKGAMCPHPMAKSAWAKEGERCCLYVAQSRAIHTLTYVYDSE